MYTIVERMDGSLYRESPYNIEAVAKQEATRQFTLTCKWLEEHGGKCICKSKDYLLFRMGTQYHLYQVQVESDDKGKDELLQYQKRLFQAYDKVVCEENRVRYEYKQLHDLIVDLQIYERQLEELHEVYHTHPTIVVMSLFVEKLTEATKRMAEFLKDFHFEDVPSTKDVSNLNQTITYAYKKFLSMVKQLKHNEKEMIQYLHLVVSGRKRLEKFSISDLSDEKQFENMVKEYHIVLE